MFNPDMSIDNNLLQEYLAFVLSLFLAGENKLSLVSHKYFPR